MQPAQSVHQHLFGPGEVTATSAHGEHGSDDPSLAVVFIDEDVAASVMHGAVEGENLGPNGVRQRVRGGQDHPRYFVGPVQSLPAAIRIGAGRHDHLVARDVPRTGSHAPFHPVAFDLFDPRAGVKLHALLYRRAGKAARVAEGVQVSSGLENPATVKAFGTRQLPGFRGVDHAGRAAGRGIAFRLLPHPLDPPRRERAMEIAVLLPFAIDLVVPDEGCRHVRARGLAGDQPLRPFRAEMTAQIAERHIGKGRRAMAGIAAGAAEAGFLRLQQHDLHAATAQLDRGRQTRITATDNADVCGHAFLKRTGVGCRDSRGVPEGVFKRGKSAHGRTSFVAAPPPVTAGVRVRSSRRQALKWPIPAPWGRRSGRLFVQSGRA